MISTQIQVVPTLRIQTIVATGQPWYPSGGSGKRGRETEREWERALDERGQLPDRTRMLKEGDGLGTKLKIMER